MRIACVHQGYELYGSDRSFVESVAAIRAAFPHGYIEVVLPCDGPIVAPLRGLASRIVFEPLFILRRRGFTAMLLTAPVRFPLALLRAAARFRRFDAVYINTMVVLDHILVSRFFRSRAILHVHEIADGSALSIFRALLRWSGAEIVFNSNATCAAYALGPDASARVIYNGIVGPSDRQAVALDAQRPLRILMLGRINRIKGQEVLIEAIAALPPALRARIETRIVGSAFEDPARERALADMVKDRGLGASVQLFPFVDDPSGHLRWADIVAVPSRLPESLGRVAIEAMAYERPPLASAIGGLVEIVEDGRTGWLVPPGDAEALSRKIVDILAEPGKISVMGLAARKRYETVFSDKAAADAIGALVTSVLARRAAQGPGGTATARNSAETTR